MKFNQKLKKLEFTLENETSLRKKNTMKMKHKIILLKNYNKFDSLVITSNYYYSFYYCLLLPSQMSHFIRNCMIMIPQREEEEEESNKKEGNENLPRQSPTVSLK